MTMQRSLSVRVNQELVLDASGINDLDATGVDMLDELLPELEQRCVDLHLADVKGPVRDVLRRAGIWERSNGRIHASTSDAVAAIVGGAAAPADHRRLGIDEHPDLEYIGDRPRSTQGPDRDQPQPLETT